MALPVVVGVDGSESSLLALDWAVDEAARRGVPLRIVHTSLWDRYEPDPTDNEDLARARKAVAVLVTSATERAVRRQPQAEVEVEVLPEAAAPALVEQTGDASVVVVGSRGRGGFAGMLLGSVSLEVAAHCACPLVVVRGGGDAIGRRHERIVLGVSGREAPGPAVAFAYGQAARWRAELELVHAWSPEPAPGLTYGLVTRGPGASEADLAERLLAAAAAEAAALCPDVRTRMLARPGRPHAVLLEAAAEADLLVVGARRRHGPGLHLGPVNHAVLHHAPCPVAVVPRS